MHACVFMSVCTSVCTGYIFLLAIITDLEVHTQGVLLFYHETPEDFLSS